MDIRILHLLEGARQAEGLAVIIDVLRAFSLECYLADRGAAELRPVATLEEAFAWRQRDPEALLAGERGGAKCEGFDFGNSPSAIPAEAVRGRRVIHTTSAGTQGLTHAVRAGQILTGSLVNAAAVAAYIRQQRGRPGSPGGPALRRVSALTSARYAAGRHRRAHPRPSLARRRTLL